MKTAKKLFSVLLAFVMVLALAVPAWAAVDDSDTTTATGSITITSPDASNGHRFNAYQIFSGTLSSEDTLTDVQWGSGINSSNVNNLISELKKIEIDSQTPFASMTQDTAASVSDILAENNDNAALVQAFQDLITIKGDNGYTYLSGTKTEIQHDENDPVGKYQATSVNVGYYVVVDDADTNAADLMLRVVGDVQATAKLDVPSVDKYAGDKSVEDNATFSVGDEITYTLTGTTPNFVDDTFYSYKFTDTMDDALDLVYTASNSSENQVEAGVTVTIGNGEGAVDITNKFLITYINHTLTIESNTDLKDSGLTPDSTIYVTYNAKVNSKVLEHTVVNNKVILESKSGENETITPDKTEQVYPITLEITKVDGTGNTLLSGAKFILYRYVDKGSTKTKQYATTDLATSKFTGWTDDKTQAATLTSDTDGKITLIGIGAGTFYLQETEAPTGYNKLSTILKIDVQTTSETDGTGTVKLAELKYALTDVDANDDTKEATGGANDGSAVNVTGEDLANGKVAFNVTNNQGAQLPSTGGTGTTIFYVIGGVLVVAAIVLLVTRKRMNNAD